MRLRSMYESLLLPEEINICFEESGCHPFYMLNPKSQIVLYCVEVEIPYAVKFNLKSETVR